MIYAITRISPQAITPYNLDYSLPYITYRFPQLAVKKKLLWLWLQTAKSLC